jgi:hypothetical protein
MQEIEQLGADIERAWNTVHYRTDDFASIAQAALESRALSACLSTERIVRWLALSPAIPHQPSGAMFGEPPIQVYADRRFYIELLFWVDGTTAIHQHSFSGAFQVVLGSSIHTTYGFEREQAIDRELLLGKLTAAHSELLHAGDVRPIVSGNRFIHSLFHLERPSVTLVVRTRQDPGTMPQFSYLHPGIAYDPYARNDRASRLTRLLDVLDPRSPQTTRLLTELIDAADLTAVARRHAALSTSLLIALKEARRQALVIRRRRSHRRADLRFFLALLLNIGDRSQILQFVEQQLPGEDPLDRIATWIQDLMVTPATDPEHGHGAGHIEYDLGEAELKVLGYLLRQRTPNEIVALLEGQYDDVEPQRHQILDLCATLADAALFRPLFQTMS